MLRGFLRSGSSSHTTELDSGIVSLAIDWLRLNDATLCLGIFRVSGSFRALEQLKALALKKMPRAGLKIFHGHTAHTVAGLLKLYFRELDPPLLTYDLFDAWVTAVQIEDQDERRHCLRKTLASLPLHNFQMLFKLIEYLSVVAQHHNINKMDSKNLGIIFGPSLLRTAIADPFLTLQQNQDAVDLVVELIEGFDELFSVFTPEQNHERRVPSPRSPLPKELGDADRRMSSHFETALNHGSLRLSLHNSLRGILEEQDRRSSEQRENQEHSTNDSPARPARSASPAPVSPVVGRREPVDFDELLRRLSQSPGDVKGVTDVISKLSDSQLSSLISKIDQNLGFHRAGGCCPMASERQCRRESKILLQPLPDLQQSSVDRNGVATLAERLYNEHSDQPGATATLALEAFRLFYRALCSEISELCPWSIRDIDELFSSIVGIAPPMLRGSESISWSTFSNWLARQFEPADPASTSTRELRSPAAVLAHQGSSRCLHRLVTPPSLAPASSSSSETKPGGKSLTPLRAIFKRATEEQLYLPLERLQRRDLPAKVDLEHLEMHLSPEDFALVFGMSKNRFVLLPLWTRTHLKQRVNLLHSPSFADCHADSSC